MNAYALQLAVSGFFVGLTVWTATVLLSGLVIVIKRLIG